jgi:hypothetical protein
MPQFKPDQQDLARRRGHWALKTQAANTRLLESLNRQQVQTSPGQITWIVTAGDELTLRGIPAIGRGVQGAIAGTNPA